MSFISLLLSSELSSFCGFLNTPKAYNNPIKNIINNINKLNLGEYTDPITVASGSIILMVKDKKEIQSKLSLEDELKKAISMEQNKQFNQYSSIYFKKVELNTKIYEK